MSFNFLNQLPSPEEIKKRVSASGETGTDKKRTGCCNS